MDYLCAWDTELSPQSLIPAAEVRSTGQSIKNIMENGTIGEELNGQTGQEQKFFVCPGTADRSVPHNAGVTFLVAEISS